MGPRARPTPPADLLLLGLASFRLTRLLVLDDFPPVKAIRERLITRLGDDSLVAETLDCAWCAGWWVSLLVVALGRSRRARAALAVPALSGLVGLLSTLDSLLGRAWQAQHPAESPEETAEYVGVVR